jgi:ABC-type glycerol-3-phosphate transport system substrate-binding protein
MRRLLPHVRRFGFALQIAERASNRGDNFARRRSPATLLAADSIMSFWTGFHLGKPIGVMLALASASGAWLALRESGSPRADVVMWCFAESHVRAFTRPDLPAEQDTPEEIFERESGRSLDVIQVQYRALNTRLSTMIMSGTGWPEMPDAVEIEIGNVGRYFRPPVDEIGFLPLNDLIEQNGWSGRVVESRYAPWSKRDPRTGKQVIFGIPNDVHPVMIAYNETLFRAAGVDLAAALNWDQFVEASIRFRNYWRSQGVERRWPLELPDSNAGTLLMMLLQRGVNIIDDENRVRIADPTVLETLMFYVRLVDGPRRIGAPTAPGHQAYSQDFSTGLVGAMFAADWRLRYIKDYAPELKGKLRVMPLPRFDDQSYRTATQGGTMLAIPRRARDPQASWKLIETLYLRPEGLRGTLEGSYILPPVKDIWTDPLQSEVDPFYSDMQVRKMIVDLADEVPMRYVTPATGLAEGELAMAMIDAIRHYREHGETGFEDRCRILLSRAAESVQRRIEHGTFE